MLFMKNKIVIHNKANLFTYKFRLISLKSARETFMTGGCEILPAIKSYSPLVFYYLTLFPKT